MATDPGSIKAIDGPSVHKITSGQVVVDLQTAVKEMVENSLDAGATTIEVRFRDHGLKSIEVLDNGSGISAENYDSVGLKHHTSKLSSFEDLTAVSTFGFRGEAISSLCALSESVTVTTATTSEVPMGTVLELDRSGKVTSRSGKVARQRGTTVTVTGLFKPLPVRRKEFERNAKRELAKALTLLSAYALIPCSKENQGVRLTVSNQDGKLKAFSNSRKTVALRTDGTPSLKTSVSALWGPKALDDIVALDLSFEVETEKAVIRRLAAHDITTHAFFFVSSGNNRVRVAGLISKFALGCGRTTKDRQFFFINGRPCNPAKVQKAFNEVYRTFNVSQSPFIVADFILPTDSCDINVSPDKRTILLHSEGNLIRSLKAALEDSFSTSRSTYNLNEAGRTSSGLEQEVTPSPPRETEKSSEVNNEDSTANIADEIPSSQPITVDEAESSDGLPLFDESRPESPESTAGDPAAPTHNQPNSGPIPESDRSANEGDPIAVQVTVLSQDVPSEATTVFPRSPEPNPMKRKDPPVQMVLNTSGASWNLTAKASTHEDRPHKKPRIDSGQVASVRLSANSTGKKAGLWAFALPGTLRPEVAPREDIVEISLIASTKDSEVELGDDDETAQTPGDQQGRSPSPILPIDNGTDAEDGLAGAIPNEIIGASDRQRSSSPNLPTVLDVSEPETGLMETPSDLSQQSRNACPPDPDDDVVLSVDLTRLGSRWESARSMRPTAVNGEVLQNLVAGDRRAGLENRNEEEAAAALSRVIDKNDLKAMMPIGQFNKGFIIARRRRSSSGSSQGGVMDDLFIVDQHASDEKFNFETLQQTTRVESQRLIRPQPLRLSAADELMAIENMDVLNRNGFDILVDDSEDREPSKARLSLVGQPVSKSVTFDMKDLEEILSLMHDRPAGQMVRCSKVRAMFASRACRKSVMIGDSLNRQQMIKILQNMSTIEQPWNCPHGRPTMRHLCDISAVPQRPVNTIDWDGYRRRLLRKRQ
ncbi:hypothetical protein BJ322DRAFT_1002088 [Thelephora terrestris]|uniref:DNA mismatch repair protein PMS1 n=1 Tax=Thelephora terrestris TaxID=56493 RepID=A0A9P6HIX6_9AGAM|nr:hypothetical protein BJ322DRAFT_1002088 [Thelephora terrestris]